MSSKLRVIVTGLIAEYPLGGMTWHYLQYVLGLARLGHDVYYIEDSGGWPYNPLEGGLGYDCEYNVNYLAEIMSRYGFADRWAYRLKGESRSTWFGLSDADRQSIVRSADLVINVSGTIDCPDDYRAAERLVYIDTDPVFAQFKLIRGDVGFPRRVDAHDVHFTFGERVAEELPPTGHQWLPTRQPIVLDEWTTREAPRDVYTTVMNWTSYKSEAFQGRKYGQKDIEFMRFIDLPARAAPSRFEIAGGPGYGDATPRDMIIKSGWTLTDPMKVCPDYEAYRRYIQTSKAEWSVAKNAYVQGQVAWFSERSACYLAAGRPVIVQDTGFSQVFETGMGLLAFTTLDEALAAVEAVNRNYAEHGEAARATAERYFDASLVLDRLIAQSMCSHVAA